MQYAKLISGTEIDATPPDRAIFDGRLFTGNLRNIPGLLESIGYYPLDESVPAPDPAPGCHVEPRFAHDSAASPTRIIRTWVQVEDPPPPPRSLSKRRLRNALADMGLWAAVKDYMVASGVWEDFDLATTLDEDDPLVVSAVAALRAQLDLTDSQIESILSASVAE